jgi:alpha-beta hydrolase superfamily lysophospholipase
MKHPPEGVITSKEGSIQREDIVLSYAIMMPHVSKALVLIVHGINDHKGRYVLLQEDLAEAGYSSVAFDQRGFGLSGGKRADVARYQDYHDDLSAILGLIRVECPNENIFLLGHSLGGLISATYCIDHPGAVAGLVLSSPAFEVPHLPFH